MTLTHRSKVCAFVVLSLLPQALPGHADVPAAPASQPALQPFAPSAVHSTDPNGARVLGGVWKGTFTHKNDDGTGGESTYIVQVGPGLTTLRVSVAPSAQGPAIPETPIAELLQPTFEAQPVVWDGTTLQAFSRKEHLKIGNAKVDVEKRLSLRLERDAKHAMFTYDIRVTSVTGYTTVTNSRQGSGVLTRPR